MNLNFSPEEQAFRQEVRRFFEEQYPSDIRAKFARGESLSKEDFQCSERMLACKGWSAPGWPVEYGGPGWTDIQRYIFDEEMGRAGIPNVTPMGIIYLGPVLYTFGTENQKKRWLSDILHSRTFWAQGYSEPNAGSDLASLQCRAIRDGNDYIVTGEKIWTSYGHYADWIFCLVRTDQNAPRHAGISFLCIDMKSPGVEVHPIPSIDGKLYLNRVTFDGVRVPRKNRIGEENKGWHYATFLLGHERTSYAQVGAKKQLLKQIKSIAAHASGPNGGSLLEDLLFRRRLAQAEIKTMALEYTVLRLLIDTETDPAGGKSSILKIMATETAQAISTMLLELSGHHCSSLFEDAVTPQWAIDAGLPDFAAPGTAKYLYDRSQSIYGGTNEIQRNVIAKRVLGL